MNRVLEKEPYHGAWPRLPGKGDAFSGQARAVVVESWERCREFGLSPYQSIRDKVKTQSEILEIMAKTEELREAANPLVERLLRFVQGSGFVAALTDETCCIVALYGDPVTLKKVRNMDCQVGAVWTEDEIGTNAIGIAAMTKQPVQISGNEHYLAKYRHWSCSAAPLLKDNVLMGILSILGPIGSIHSQTLGMVVAASQAIEIRLENDEQFQRQRTISSQLNSVFEVMSEGVIVLDKNGHVRQVNTAAGRILDCSISDIMGSNLIEIMHDHAEKITRLLDRGQECEFEFVLGANHAAGIGKSIFDREKRVMGATIILRPIAQVRQSRMAGAEAQFTFDSIIGQDPSMKNAIKLGKIASRTSSNVLMQGESGTGKEVFAQAIHNGSSRRKGPFVAINCAALPRELVGSELFGYDEGAFTGAKRDGRPGKFELANGGTLLLDEIGDMPLEQQGSLLRAIQEKAVVRVGGDKVIRVNVRIIAATNQDLLGLVAQGRFRQDLYYRLNVMQVTIPPLRDRRSDIPLLFRYFLDDMCRKLGKVINKVDDDVLRCLCAYNWPGNVRELQNIVERTSLVVEDGHVTVSHLPQEVTSLNQDDRGDGWEWGPRSVIAVAHETYARENRKRAMEEKEKENIIQALDNNGGNVSKTAISLGISRNTLYRRLKKYGIQN